MSTPVLPTVLIGVVAILILGVNIGQAQLFTAITGVAVVIVYLAYLLVTVPMLIIPGVMADRRGSSGFPAHGRRDPRGSPGRLPGRSAWTSYARSGGPRGAAR